MVRKYDDISVAGLNTTLWRYMSLSKLLQMLQSRTLWFTRVDQLIASDPYEGSLPFAPAVTTETQAKDAQYERKHQMTAGTLERSREIMLQLHNMERKKTFVSCWHSGADDNDAMWRLYGAEHDGSICIKSTVADLIVFMPEYVVSGRIDYVSYDQEWPNQHNLFVPFYRKRRCFEHEKEVRFLINGDHMVGSLIYDEERKGIPVPFVPESSISEIYVSPTSNPWFKQVVQDAVQRLGLNIPISDAPMARLPTF